jgi:hypothetical protein
MAACATPQRDEYHPLNVRAPRDAKGEFHVDEHPGGFTIQVEYARHQDRADNAAVARTCRTALVAIARELAEIRSRKIKPIDESAADVEIRRNDATRLTFCDGRLAVEYVK